MAIVWDEAMFRKYYRFNRMPNGPDGKNQTATFSRIGWRYYRGPEYYWNYDQSTWQTANPDYPINEYRWRVECLGRRIPGFVPGTRVLILGCGYGMLGEALQWAGWAQDSVAGVDNSTFIQGNISSEAHPTMRNKVVNRDLRVGAANTQMRNSLRNAAGGSEFFDFVITESVIESYLESERQAFLDACETYLAAGQSKSNMLHIVFPEWDATEDGGSPPLTQEQWAASRPSHSWVSYLANMPAILGT